VSPKFQRNAKRIHLHLHGVINVHTLATCGNSLTTRSRSKGYLAMGNWWPGGSGKTKVSAWKARKLALQGRKVGIRIMD